MNNNAQQIERMILVTLSPGEIPDEARILSMIERLREMFPIEESDREALVKSLHARLAIRMDVGTILVASDHEPWLLARKPSINPRFWDRYQKFLASRNWPPVVLNTLDRVTDEILDGCGNPEKTGVWARRGLVMGDVQSGKTSTYTGLACKAADAGYELIVLLTGTLESLRRQTQERLDEGFVGLDSAPFLTRENAYKRVGAGLIDQTFSGAAFTSRIGDFSMKTMTQLNFQLASFRVPILLVVKKNKQILQNLEDWLRNYNAQDGKISIPMLLVDDEADNASVNVGAKGEDPKAINTRIRALLNLFRRSTYVGFTATPFANIFIEPESTHAMLGDDLFPRDFLYALEPPTNYIGAEAIFSNEHPPTRVLDIDDAEPYFPAGHDSSLVVDDVPDSLKSAVLGFIIANAIRDLRGEGPTHRSMLVNVSRLTAVQSSVADILDAYLRSLQQDIRNYAQLPESEALLDPSIASIHKCWQDDFQDAGSTWSAVQRGLAAASLPITVKAVNQRTGAASLDYSAHKKTGLRVVAVGGNSLSRGITLEGLSESYFFRNSQMYDTLLQMGRWFGYRDGYADLCRVWLTLDAQQWYSHITTATMELRDEVRRMRRHNMTPEDFGLKVRAHPDGLIVTARNKMRTAKTIEKVISVSEQYLETPRIWADTNKVKANAMAVGALLEMLQGSGIKAEEDANGGLLWRGVRKEHVISLLRAYNAHPYNFIFQTEELADYLIATTEPMLATWDVAIPSGRSKVPVQLPGGFTGRPQERSVKSKSSGELLVSGKSARVASRGAESIGMDPQDIAAAESDFKKDYPDKENVPDKAYRRKRRHPLLLLHLIIPFEAAVPPAKGVKIPYEHPVWALGLSFPDLGDEPDERRVRYNINLVEWQTRFEVEAEDDVEVDVEAVDDVP
jgi:hypothetical protein